jgi:cell wall-associated NlpC family hydrolase
LSSRAQGRHRAAVRPKTPLSTIATQIQVGAGTAGRRGAVIAASSGLVVSLGVTAADAAPIGDAVQEKPKAAPAAETVAAPAPVVAEAEQLTVPADAGTATVGVVAGTLVAPPKPKPVVVPERAAPVSRDTDRSTERASSSSSSSSSRSSSEESTQKAAAPEASGNLSATRANVIAVAARYVGTPYRSGGTSPSGFDCSGYVQYVFAQVGISLPRTSSAQAGAAVRISRAEAQPGDLVYKPGHIGIYAGGNLMYDSPTTGKSVSKREMWSSDFGFYRVIGG